MLAVSACITVSAMTALRDREAVLTEAEASLAATARLLEAHADRALESGQRAVQAVVQAVGDPRTMHQQDRRRALHRQLQDVVEGSPQLASAWILDAGGHTVAESWGHPPLTTVSFVHREYFRAHRDGEAGSHIGPVAPGPRAARPRFTLSRPLTTPAGEFAGVAVTGVETAYFAGVYADAGLRPDTRFALYRSDGMPLVLWPDQPGSAAARDLPSWAALPGAGTAVAPAGEELRVIRHLARFPVLLVVSQPVATVLEGWQTRTLRSAALAGGFVLAIGGLTLLGLHGARQERALTAALWAERETLERRVAERTADLAESEARFREAADTAPMMVWVGDATGACLYRSRSWHDFTGQAPDAALGTGWLATVHPADRDGVAATVAAAQRAASPFRLEYRLRRADGAWRQVLDVAALRRGRDGCFLGHVGSVLDITERHEAAERQAMMARELDHRAKNALAVVQAALRLTPKRDAHSYAQAVEGRVAALARAHGALAQCRWQGVSLRDVVEGELAAALPARDQPAAARPVRIAGPVVALAPGSVQAIAMALHELATNATRFGSLSRPDGGVEVTWSLDGAKGMLELRWLERGGPSLAGPPQERGFGFRVIEGTVAQLGGRVERHWEALGLDCRIVLPLHRVLSSAALRPAPARKKMAPVA